MKLGLFLKVAVAALVTLVCTFSAKAQTTYQPVGSHVVYTDGSTDFYYEVKNPSTGQQSLLTLFVYCNEQKATVINAGVYAPIDIAATCLVPPNVGPVSITSGGTVNVNGMTVTLNPSNWTIAKATCTRSGCIEYVVSSSIFVPLTIQ